jgi:hypothetical protein
MLKRRFACAAAAVLLAASAAHAGFEQKNTRIIEWGWDTSGSAPEANPFAPPALPGNIATYEQNLAFDGAGINLRRNAPFTNGSGDLYGFNAFGSATLSTSTYSDNITALQNTPFNRFKANNLVLEVVPGDVDWFDNGGFNAVSANAQTLAGVGATIPSLNTILLDVESYQGRLWQYDSFSTAQKNAHTFAQYQAQVRTRGAQFMNAMRAAMPNVQVLLTMGYERADGTGPADENGLLPSFIDGLLDAAGSNNTIYDGYEYAYSFRQSAQFESAYQQMRVSQASITGNVAAYNAHYRASYGLWLDYASNTLGWSSSNPSANYFTPDKFHFALQQAAMRSDGFVWVYSEQPSWYAPQVSWGLGAGAVPQAYKDALASVRREGKLERFNGSTKDTSTWGQHTEGLGTILQNNALNISANNGEADFTTLAVRAGIGDIVSVEITPTSSLGSALLGLALSNDSGGTSTNVLADSRSLLLAWSDVNNGIMASFADANGAGAFVTVAGGDHPLNNTYLYEIERISSNAAKFTVWNTTTGTLVGTPLTRTFVGVPDTLLVSLFAKGGTATFDNVWVGSAPEPTTACSLGLLIVSMITRRRRPSICSHRAGSRTSN